MTWFETRVVILMLITIVTLIVTGTIHAGRGRVKPDPDVEYFMVSSAVSNLFKSVLQRPPDHSELETYQNAVASGIVTIPQVQSILLSTPEYSKGGVSENSALDRLIASLRTRPLVTSGDADADADEEPEVEAKTVFETDSDSVSSTNTNTYTNTTPHTNTGWGALSARALSERDVGGTESRSLTSFPEPSTEV